MDLYGAAVRAIREKYPKESIEIPVHNVPECWPLVLKSANTPPFVVVVVISRGWPGRSLSDAERNEVQRVIELHHALAKRRLDVWTSEGDGVDATWEASWEAV
jgi:hypothetical protein